ncbi:Acetylcholinesterase [Habropoda laboriosa]|uniref:Acetylcholinesterase n=1 Tax=Habropoda laboriosa TaxID=597456 RepID=A0A0L7QSV0_9HYME|nr:Acetylcholinesterase [Habropoda laboriosa]
MVRQTNPCNQASRQELSQFIERKASIFHLRDVHVICTYFILYDFNDVFEKDKPTFVKRDRFVNIINNIFKNMSQIERDAITFQYTDWEQVNNGYLYQKMIADVVGDYFFICPSIHFAQLFADRGMKVYYYFFTQRTSSNLWGEWMGVLHGDEVEYVFGHPMNMSLKYSKEERDLSIMMIRYFSKFAYTGQPTNENEWPPYSRDQPQYYIFNAETTGLGGKGLRTTACAFWNDFLPRLKGVPGSYLPLLSNFHRGNEPFFRNRSFHEKITDIFSFLSSLIYRFFSASQEQVYNSLSSYLLEAFYRLSLLFSKSLSFSFFPRSRSLFSPPPLSHLVNPDFPLDRASILYNTRFPPLMIFTLPETCERQILNSKTPCYFSIILFPAQNCCSNPPDYRSMKSNRRKIIGKITILKKLDQESNSRPQA